MEKYIGTKIINAKPMTRLEYNNFRGWELPADENVGDDGYMVEYTDGGNPNVEGFDGYVSWSPKEQFENAYRLTDGLTFGLASEAMLKGKKVARSGWNGKGMFLFLVAGDAWNFETDISGVDSLPTCSFVCMKTATNDLIPWLCSQADKLATDWQIVE